MPNLALTLGAWAQQVDWRHSSAAVRATVHDSLIDTVGVALAAAGDPRLAPLEALLVADSGAGVRIWGSARRTAPASAALRNATAAHLLDFDDVHYGIHGHPSAVLFPAAIAAAEWGGADGATMLSGYLAGVGVMAAVHHAFGPRHYARGWHSTSTCGAIAAAACVGRVWGFDATRLARAMSTAASLAGGVRANFGSVLKPMHAGFAARAGVEAALLTRAGTVPADDALGGRYGAVAVFGDGSWSPADPAEWDHLRRVAHTAPLGLARKPYPSCRGSHYGIDAALRVRDQLLPGEEIRRVRIVLPLGGDTGLLHDDPATGLEAKFSAPYTVATSLVYGPPTLAHFSDRAVRDGRVRALMKVTSVHIDARTGDLSGGMAGRFAEVTVDTSLGRAVTARESDPLGSVTNPMTREQVRRKFLHCVGAHGPRLLAALDRVSRWRSLAEAPLGPDPAR